jgi:mannose-1-phosphate guanylyltransferase
VGGDTTLLQATFKRVEPLVRKGNIIISTTPDFVDIVQEQLPMVARDNIIVEPARRDTAPALAFVAHELYKRDPDAVITTTPADHVNKNNAEYVNAVQAAFRVLDRYPERIGLIGIKPTEPSTELGYIRLGNEMRDTGCGRAVYRVNAFVEKPNQRTATQYFHDFAYLWNGAYFVFRAQTFLGKMQEHAPQIMEALYAMDQSEDARSQYEIFAAIAPAPIDTMIMEKLSDEEAFVIPATLTWSDVGNWHSLHAFCCNNGSQDKTICHGDVIALDTRSCFIHASTSTIATFGIKDIVIVEHDGVIAVLPKSESGDIKRLIGHIKNAKRSEVL